MVAAGNMIKHVNIKLIGRVQGVFFRVAIKEKAEELKVKGFVRNEDDGSVYVEAEGETEGLEKLVEWCRQGPRLAQVTNVLVEPGAREQFTDFSILR